MPPDNAAFSPTGERINSEGIPRALYGEHLMRYRFAGSFAKDGCVVDVACGTGMGTALLARMGARVCFGFDLHLATVQRAARYRDCRFGVCDAARLPLSEGAVDCIVSLETLEHLHAPESLVECCARALRPGGVLIVSTPNRSMYRWLGRNPYHVHEFTRDELVGMLRRHFESVDLYAQSEQLYPWFLLRRSLLNLLAALRVKEILKRVLRPSWTVLRTDVEFDPHEHFPPYEVRPYIRRTWHRALYFVVACRKAGSMQADPREAARRAHPVAAASEPGAE